MRHATCGKNVLPVACCLLLVAASVLIDEPPITMPSPSRLNANTVTSRQAGVASATRPRQRNPPLIEILPQLGVGG